MKEKKIPQFLRYLSTLLPILFIGMYRYSLTPDVSDSGLNILQEEKTTCKAGDAMDSNLGRKRSGAPENSDPAEDRDMPEKRMKASPSVSEESTRELDKSITIPQDGIPSTRPTTSRGDVDTGPAQQLVAMFGALVAQGEKAIGSLEILISSISADLLAEVVMANMRYLPPNLSKAEGDDLLMNMTIVGSDTDAKYPPSFLADVLSLSSTFPPIVSLLDAHQSMSNEIVVWFSLLIWIPSAPFLFFFFGVSNYVGLVISRFYFPV